MIAALTVLAIVPAVVALVVLLVGDAWFPGGDMAQAELHMRGFFSHPPLVGAAGRIVSDTGIQGSHPGPSLWVAMLPVYVLGGRTSAALMAAVVSVHLLATWAIVWLAHRRGGSALAAGSAVAVLLIVRSSGPDFLIEPWNPWLAILPFGVFVLLLAEVVVPTSATWERHRPMIAAAAVLVGSHCIQSHAGYALLVLGGLVGAVSASLVRTKADRRFASALGIVAASGVAGSVIWLPPILDQIRREPGNLEILWQHFGSPSEPTIGLGTAAREIAAQVNIVGPWIFGPDSPGETWGRWMGFVAFVALWSWSFVTARRHGWRNERTVLSVAGFLVLIGAISISRIFGPFYEYTIRWMWVLIALNLVIAGVVILRTMAPHLSPSRVVASRRFALALVIGLSIATSVQIASAVKLPGATDSRITANLHRQLLEDLERGQRYLIRFYDPYTLNATGFGVTLALERSGFDVGVEPAFAAAALPHRTRTEVGVDEVLWVVVGPAVDRARSDRTLSEKAYYNPRRPDEQIRAERLLVDIAAGLRRTGRADLVETLQSPGASLIFVEPPLEPDVAELVRQLIRMGQPVGVFASRPGVRPPSLY